MRFCKDNAAVNYVTVQHIPVNSDRKCAVLAHACLTHCCVQDYRNPGVHAYTCTVCTRTYARTHTHIQFSGGSDETSLSYRLGATVV
jgi:hypothetical protein